MSDSYLDLLLAERARLAAERARIDGQLEGVETALRLYRRSNVPAESGENAPAVPAPPPPASAQAPEAIDRSYPRATPGSFKEFALSLIKASGADGLTPGELRAEVERLGRAVHKNTITSLLSAEKKAERLEIANGRYRIPQGMPAAVGAAGLFNRERSVEAVQAARKVGGT